MLSFWNSHSGGSVDFVSDPIQKLCTCKHYAPEQSCSLLPDGFFQQPRRVAVATSLFKILCVSGTLLNEVWEKEQLDHKSDFSLRCSQDRLLHRSAVSCAELTVQQWWMGGLLPVKAWEFVGIPGLTSSTASQNHQGKTGWHMLSKLKTCSNTVPADSGYSLFLLQEVNLRRVIGWVSKRIILSKFMFSTFPIFLSKAEKKICQKNEAAIIIWAALGHGEDSISQSAWCFLYRKYFFRVLLFRVWDESTNLWKLQERSGGYGVGVVFALSFLVATALWLFLGPKLAFHGNLRGIIKSSSHSSLGKWELGGKNVWKSKFNSIRNPIHV